MHGDLRTWKTVHLLSRQPTVGRYRSRIPPRIFPRRPRQGRQVPNRVEHLAPCQTAPTRPERRPPRRWHLLCQTGYENVIVPQPRPLLRSRRFRRKGKDRRNVARPVAFAVQVQLQGQNRQTQTRDGHATAKATTTTKTTATESVASTRLSIMGSSAGTEYLGRSSANFHFFFSPFFLIGGVRPRNNPSWWLVWQ